GIAFFTGASQAAKEAAAMPNPIIFKKSLREAPSPPFSLFELMGKYSGNSLCARFIYSGSLVNCSIPFQYVFLLSFMLCFVFDYHIPALHSRLGDQNGYSFAFNILLDTVGA